MKETFARVELELRLLPRFRVMDYLVQMGGEETGILSVSGPGWQAFIEALEPDHLGIVAIARDRLVIEGEEVAVGRVASFMEQQIRQMRRTLARRQQQRPTPHTPGPSEASDPS